MNKVLKLVFGALACAFVGGIVGRQIKQNKTDISNKKNKFKEYYNILNQWISIKNEGKSISDYFKQKDINKIAIYGMGELGNNLLKELDNTGITVCYGIDQNSAYTYSKLILKNVNDDLPEVDAIVVTPIFAYKEIYDKLSVKVDYPIISIEDIIYGL